MTKCWHCDGSGVCDCAACGGGACVSCRGGGEKSASEVSQEARKLSAQRQETSQLGAQEYIDSGAYETHKEMVRAAGQRYPGHSAREISDASGIEYETVKRRLSDLWRDGEFDKVIGHDESGRKKLLWVPIAASDPRYRVAREPEICPRCHQVIPEEADEGESGAASEPVPVPVAPAGPAVPQMRLF